LITSIPLVAVTIRFNEYFETDCEACLKLLFCQPSTAPSPLFLRAMYIDDVLTSADCTKEIEYYFSSHTDHYLTQKKCIEGLWCLYTKKRFESVDIRVQGNVIDLHFARAWLLERVYVKGVLFGRNQYAQFYTIRPGDPFVQSSHTISLARIREALYAQGYYDADVVDRCVYNKVNKSIRVYLHITLSKRFVFGSVTCEVCSTKCSNIMKADLIDHINKKYNRKLVGSLYNKEILENVGEQIREYVLKKGFYDSSLEIKPVICYSGKQVHVTFVIHVGGYKCIEFFGNTFFTTQQLFAKVVPYPQMLGAVVAYAGMRELEQLYHSYGFYDAAITTQNSDNHIVFIIHEGCRYSVKDVCIQIDAHESSVEKIFFDQENYKRELIHMFLDDGSINAIRSELLEYFLHQGYWDCTVDFEVQPYSDQKMLVVNFLVHQGLQRYIGVMTFDDDIRGAYDVLVKKYAYLQSKHEVFDSAYIKQIEQTIIEYAKSCGIVRLRIVPEIVEEGSIVSIRWKSYGASHSSMGEKVILAGLSKIKAARLYAHLGIKETSTQVWQSSEAMQKRTRLIKLGVFDRVDIHSQYIDSIGRPLAVVTLHDAPSFQYGIKGGLYCSGNKVAFKNISYKVGGECVLKNITKHADYGTFVASRTRYQQNIQARYLYPWASSAYTLTECRVYSNRYDQPLYYGSFDSLYHDARDGGAVSISSDCCSGRSVLEMGFERYIINKLCKEKALSICFCPKLIDRAVNSFCAEYSFIYNGVDDSFNPRRGLSIAFITTMHMPFTTIYDIAIKGIVESSFYIPCYVATLAFRSRVGYIGNQKFCCISPSDRFYLGGGNSIRGYDVDQVPPLVCMYDDKGQKKLVAIGGKTMFATNAECRFPLHGNLHGMLFFDSGILLQDESIRCTCADQSIYAYSYGFGLSYLTPLGPVRFDFGWKGRRVDPIESKFAWHFSFGYAF